VFRNLVDETMDDCFTNDVRVWDVLSCLVILKVLGSSLVKLPLRLESESLRSDGIKEEETQL
jgi:hypothetical protein